MILAIPRTVVSAISNDHGHASRHETRQYEDGLQAGIIRYTLDTGSRCKQVLVCAPGGKAVDEALAEGAGDTGLTVAKALQQIEGHQLCVDRSTVLVVDEAAMVGM